MVFICCVLRLWVFELKLMFYLLFIGRGTVGFNLEAENEVVHMPCTVYFLLLFTIKLLPKQRV